MLETHRTHSHHTELIWLTQNSFDTHRTHSDHTVRHAEFRFHPQNTFPKTLSTFFDPIVRVDSGRHLCETRGIYVTGYFQTTFAN